MILEGRAHALFISWSLAANIDSACQVTQSCLTLCDSMDHSLVGSSVHGIFQVRILEWVAMPSSRGSSQPRDGWDKGIGGGGGVLSESRLTGQMLS